MKNKAQELEVRTIMQGLEEFATFMSYKGNSAGLRIISVESVQQPITPSPFETKSADIIPLSKRRISSDDQQSVYRSLAFQDRQTH